MPLLQAFGGVVLVLLFAAATCYAPWRELRRMLRDRQTFDATGSPVTDEEAPHIWRTHFLVQSLLLGFFLYLSISAIGAIVWSVFAGA